MTNARFLPEYRIRRPGDFRRAYDRHASVADGVMIVYAYPNGLAHPRLGLSVSRRVGNAVVRNGWKRLLREAFRQSRPELPEGIDFVVIPRPNLEPTLKALLDSMPRLAERAARKLRR